MVGTQKHFSIKGQRKGKKKKLSRVAQIKNNKVKTRGL